MTTLRGSSHREAPLISEDPVADNTDVYAFVSPDKPDTVTFVANWIPLEEPAGGPNFYKFGDEVLYTLNIDNDGDARDDIVYEFRFKTAIQNEEGAYTIDIAIDPDSLLTKLQIYGGEPIPQRRRAATAIAASQCCSMSSCTMSKSLLMTGATVRRPSTAQHRHSTTSPRHRR